MGSNSHQTGVTVRLEGSVTQVPAGIYPGSRATVAESLWSEYMS